MDHIKLQPIIFPQKPEQNNNEAVLLFNQGNAAFRQSKWQDAIDYFQTALSIQADLEPAAFQKARCHVKLGEADLARSAFKLTLKINPSNYSAHLEFGHLNRIEGNIDAAIESYLIAIKINSDRYEAYVGLTRAYETRGQSKLSEDAFNQAFEIATHISIGRTIDVAHRVGCYRLELGNAIGAINALERGITFFKSQNSNLTAQEIKESQDQIYEILIDLGDAYWRIGQTDKVYSIFTQASGATQEATLARLGSISYRLNLWQDGIEVLRRNLELHPNSQSALWNLAHLLAECWHMDEAEIMLKRAEALGPVAGAASMRASIAGKRGDADSALQQYHHLASQENGESLASSAAMSSLYSDRLTPAEVSALHQRLFKSLGSGARSPQSFKRSNLGGRRIRVGLVSADFHHQHPVNIFMQPILRELNRQKFELFVYFTGVSHDDQTTLARARTDHWREVSTFNDTQLARCIDDDAIDLLVDLAGHTGQQRMSLFGKRAAPVQATYLGYPGSTGVPNIDWILGDANVTPQEDDHLCSEKVWRLPNTVFCYSPEADYPYPDYSETIGHRPIVFGSFNNVPKLTPKTLSLWAQILKAVPHSRLLLKAPSFMDAGAIGEFSKRLGVLGIDMERVEFRGPTGLDFMMAEYADMDIALDPTPYNGGTTTLQAMWMGVPVVTLKGGQFVSRMGASFLQEAGLAQWVATNEEQYIEIACRMASNRLALSDLKRGLRSRIQSLPGWDIKAHTRAIENAFETMVQLAYDQR